MRMFVGIYPPLEVVEAVEDFLEPRRDAQPLRWSRPEAFHVTLAFCPQVPEHALDDLGERLTEVGARHTPFTLGLRGGGTFPDPDHAKLLYAAVDLDATAASALPSLAQGARHAAVASGLDVAGGPYRPHLTLARSGRPFSAMRWLRVLEAFSSPTWRVEEFHLVQSHLGEGTGRRSRYEIIQTFPIG